MNSKYVKLAALAAIAVGGYLVIKNILGKPNEELPTPPIPDNIDGSDFPIKKGSKGDSVREVQTILLGIDANALPKYGIDGILGVETEAAIFKYLNKKSVDNQADLATLRALKDKANSNSLQNSISDNTKVSANEIINDWRVNKSKSLYSQYTQDYLVGDLSYSGQEMNVATKSAPTGALIVNSFEIKDMSVLPSGFLKITTRGIGITDKFIKVTPFSVILK